MYVPIKIRLMQSKHNFQNTFSGPNSLKKSDVCFMVIL